MKKKYIIGIIFIGAALFWQFLGWQKNKNERNLPLVETQVVSTQTLTKIINRFGTVLEHQSAEIRALVTGTLIDVKVQPGASVQAGEVLFQIDPRSYQYALQKAQATFSSDQATLNNAELNLNRNLLLLKKSYISKQDIDNLKTQVENKKLQIKVDENSLLQAKLDLEHTTIRAPFSGKISDILLKQGSVITQASSLLTTLRSFKPMDVIFSLTQNDFSDFQTEIKKGKVRVTVTQKQKAEVGEIQFIDNVIDQKTGTITLKATFPNQDEALWPGQYVQVNLPIQTFSHALVIPSFALLSGQQGFYVYVLNKKNSESKVEMRPVEVIATIQDKAVIGKGLSLGEQVVTSGQLNLHDQMQVRS